MLILDTKKGLKSETIHKLLMNQILFFGKDQQMRSNLNQINQEGKENSNYQLQV